MGRARLRYARLGPPQLAAVRVLFDWLVVGQVVPSNPATNVRRPSHVVSTGKAAMPTREEAKALLASIPADSFVGLRNRTLVATPLFTLHQREDRWSARRLPHSAAMNDTPLSHRVSKKAALNCMVD